MSRFSTRYGPRKDSDHRRLRRDAAPKLADADRRDGKSTTMTTAPTALTGPEQRVALLVAQGWTNSEVARALEISTKTVEAHLTKIYRKLGLRSRTELALRLLSPREAAPVRRPPHRR